MAKLSEKARRDALRMVSTVLTTTERKSRQNLFDRYMDEPYGDEVEGQSQFRATDVADVVEAVYAEGMEVFSQDDNLVEFRPVGPEDEAAARQETAIIHHFFREKNDSFINVSTWFKEGLIEQNAYVRAGWKTRRRVIIEEYEDLSFPEFMVLYNRILQDEDLDYEIEELEGLDLDADGNPSIDISSIESVSTISCRIRCVKTVKEYEIEPIPQNEIKIWPRWTKITLEGCPAVAHEGRKSKAELIDMGFSEESVEMLSSTEDDTADANRHHTLENDDDQEDDDDHKIDVVEAYVLTSVEDGEPERLLKMWTSGDGKKVLQWADGKDAIEEVEAAPFIPWSPYLVPHRHTGRAVAELAAPIQLLKTVLWRHTLDNMYSTNNVRPIVNEEEVGENTYEDLISQVPNSPIRVNGPTAIRYEKPPSILGDTLPLMDRADQELEKHAGASRYAQGLDPNALNKSQIGSEGVGRIMDAAMKRIQVIVRTFAETGLRELFLKMHSDMRRGPVREIGEKINGEWIEVKPFEWRERTDLKVRIGTGRADREGRIAALSYILGEQKEALTAGVPLVTLRHVFEAQKQMVKALGLPSIEPFMADPSKLPPQDPNAGEPSPEAQAALILAQAENKTAEAQILKAQTDRGKAEAEIDRRERELELEAQIAQAKAQEAGFTLQIRQAELEIKRAEVAIKEAVAINQIEGDQEDRDIAAMGQQ